MNESDTFFSPSNATTGMFLSFRYTYLYLIQHFTRIFNLCIIVATQCRKMHIRNVNNSGREIYI